MELSLNTNQVMNRILFVLFFVLCSAVASFGQSGLNSREFKKYWQVESESQDYRVTFRGDTCELLSPKGLTLWRKEKMRQGMTVEYDACVVDEGKPGDRLSDLNCFWLASDPHAKNLWTRAGWRSGIFVRCYTLQMYYLGYGGNHNTTTRFRRYDGNEEGVENAAKRPAILKEYTDASHLLKANHWYHVKIESKLGHTRFFIDGVLLAVGMALYGKGDLQGPPFPIGLTLISLRPARQLRTLRGAWSGRHQAQAGSRRTSW